MRHAQLSVVGGISGRLAVGRLMVIITTILVGVLVIMVVVLGVVTFISISTGLDGALLGATAAEAVVRGQNDGGSHVLGQVWRLLDVTIDELLFLVVVRIVLALVVLVTGRVKMGVLIGVVMLVFLLIRVLLIIIVRLILRRMRIRGSRGVMVFVWFVFMLVCLVFRLVVIGLRLMFGGSFI